MRFYSQQIKYLPFSLFQKQYFHPKGLHNGSLNICFYRTLSIDRDFCSYEKNIYNLYIPIGNGWHYDHRDIHRIIINLYNEEFISPNRLYLYEDLPYFAETTSSFSLTSYLQSEGICNVAITPHVFDLTDLENMWIYNYKIYESQFDKNEFNQILQYKYSHK